MSFKNLIWKICIISFIAFTIYYSFYSLYPHKISGYSADIQKYSTERVLSHIEQMAQDPHYVGTDYHAEVREYISGQLKLCGLEPYIQKEFSINGKWKGATNTFNIVAKIKGTQKGKSLMLLSHYDSAPFSSYGASDDAVGVGCILEAVRTITENKRQFKNDIIILITDGEEIGLNGAKAFVENSELIEDIGTVVNFEARGSGGPSFTLIETNDGNQNMVKALQDAEIPYPVANSFLYSVYKMLPNDTDLTMFREIADINGFNFAFIDDFFDYHCQTDDLEHVDIISVEQQGQYLMSMLNLLGNYDLNNLKSDNESVYFNFPLFNIISYPFSFNFYFLLTAGILMLFFLFAANRKGKLDLKNSIYSLWIAAVLILFAFITGKYFWSLLTIIHPSYKDILHEFPYNGKYYLVSYLSLVSAVFVFVYYKLKSRLNEYEMILPYLVIWFFINLLFYFVLPGAGFFVFPYIMIILSMIFSVLFYKKIWVRSIVHILLLIPALIIISPFIEMFPVGLRFVALYVSSILLLMLFGFILPLLYYLRTYKFITISFVFVFLLFTILAEINSGFDHGHPRPVSLNYVYYKGQERAYWETYNQTLDPWLSEIFGDSIIDGSILGIEPKSKFNTPVYFSSPAPLIKINLPDIEIISDTIIDKNRVVEFNIIPQRKVSYYELVSSKSFKCKELEINDKKINLTDKKFFVDNTLISYYITEMNEQPNFKITFEKDEKWELFIIEGSDDLMKNDQLNIKARPENTMPMPFVANNMIITISKLKF